MAASSDVKSAATPARLLKASAGRVEIVNVPPITFLMVDGEGDPAAQTLYVGPYAAERPAIERLHAFIREHGYQLRGKHHEVYLGDPRRAAPERLRTIIRQPIEPAADQPGGFAESAPR